MPVKRGHVAPQNIFLDTIIRKFEGKSKWFWRVILLQLKVYIKLMHHNLIKIVDLKPKLKQIAFGAIFQASNTNMLENNGEFIVGCDLKSVLIFDGLLI